MPIPPPRPPQRTPPNQQVSPRDRRYLGLEGRQQRKKVGKVGPNTESRPAYVFPERTRRGDDNPPHLLECPYNNVSPKMNQLLTKYQQPTRDQRKDPTNSLSATVTMPEGEQFRPAKRGLVPGTEQNFGGRGKAVRWSSSNDAPEWMRNQQADQSALIQPANNHEKGWGDRIYNRLGHTGTVSDNTISGEGPSWLVDTMDRYDPTKILHRQETKNTGLGGFGSTFEGQITDGTISGDMPSFITTAASRIDSTSVRNPPKPSWYNKTINNTFGDDKYFDKNSGENRHASHECKMDQWTYSLGGVRSTIDYGNGIQITDSSISGDAPTWMSDVILRTDPDNSNGFVINRPNNDLDFVNKTFQPEIEKIEQCWTDSTVSGDAPSWMTEQNARVDPRIVREHPKHKRPWRQRNAPTSKRDFPVQGNSGTQGRYLLFNHN